MSTARKKRHHFVPAGLLANWTVDGSRAGRIWAFHAGRADPIPTKPDDCALERSFYALDVNGLDENCIEDAYSEIEGHSLGVIARILKDRTAPSGQDRQDLIYFVAHQITRVHYGQTLVNNVAVQVMRAIVDRYLASPDDYRRIQDQLASEGQQTIPFEQFKAAFDGGLEIRFDPNRRIIECMVLANDLFKVLASRSWCLLVANGSEWGLVTSDNPVVRTRRTPRATWAEDNYGSNFDILLPLSPRTALYSSVEYEEGTTATVGDEFVARLNTRVLMGAYRQVYGSAPDLRWWSGSRGALANWSDFLSMHP